MTLQLVALITSLLSLSWGAVNIKSKTDVYEQDGEEFGHPFTKSGYILEMIWNILILSSRTVVLALFTTEYKYWLILVILVPIVLWGLFLKFTADLHKGKAGFYIGLGIGITYTFNNFLVTFEENDDDDHVLLRKYCLYVAYWVILMAENVTLVSLWYISTVGKDLWYHDIAIAYVIAAYFVSFFVKTLHTKMRRHNEGVSVWEWEC